MLGRCIEYADSKLVKRNNKWPDMMSLMIIRGTAIVLWGGSEC